MATLACLLLFTSVLVRPVDLQWIVTSDDFASLRAEIVSTYYTMLGMTHNAIYLGGESWIVKCTTVHPPQVV
jgi:hypothetical protein